MGEFDPDAFIKNATSGGSTSAATKDRRPLQDYSSSQLRQMWRAGRITEAEWQSELEARNNGNTAAAKDELATQKNVGVSTDKKTAGQLTAAEQAAVDALKPPVYQTGDRDSFENPQRASQGLSSVAPRENEQPGRPVSATGSAAGSSSTKLPLTPEEELLQKQQAARDKADLAARMQRMAEDQYILDSGGKVQRNPETGALESSIQNGQYSAVVPHTYDAKTGLVTEGAPVGWRSPTAGNTLDPRGAVWNDERVSPAMWEDLRRMNWAARSNWIRQNLGREPTASDLMSGPGGQYMQGDKTYYENLAALHATGKVLPGASSVVNPFSNAGATPQTLGFGQATPPPEMNAAEFRQFGILGDFAGSSSGKTLGDLVGLNNDMGTANGAATSASADSLGGVGSDRYNAEANARLQEMQDRQTYGNDRLPDSVIAQFYKDLQAGRIGNNYFGAGRVQPSRAARTYARSEDDDTLYQAIGGLNIAGMANVPQTASTEPWFKTNATTLPSPIAPAPAAPQMTPQQSMAPQPATAYNGVQPFSWAWWHQQGKTWDPVRGMWVNAFNPEEEDPNWQPDRGDPRNLPWGGMRQHVRQLAGGGGFMTDEPIAMVGMQTGKTKAIAGEAGAEAINVTPVAKTLPQMGGGMGAPSMGTGQMLTPTDMIRQQAKMLRPKVAFKVGG